MFWPFETHPHFNAFLMLWIGCHTKCHAIDWTLTHFENLRQRLSQISGETLVILFDWHQIRGRVLHQQIQATTITVRFEQIKFLIQSIRGVSRQLVLLTFGGEAAVIRSETTICIVCIS